ncbi:MAG: phage tail protein [Actinomycetota bacterium]
MENEPYIGSVGLTAAIYAPRETALCQGQLLPIFQNIALFSLVGTTFGGDGIQTFGLPDLRGTAPVGTGSAPSGAEYEAGDRFAALTEHAWPQGWPERSSAERPATVPTASGPGGVALSWAIALQGLFPPNPNW